MRIISKASEMETVSQNPQNPFDLIPNEILYQMCESWPTETLLNMSETHIRIYNVCFDIIEKRKQEFVLNQKIEQILNFNVFKAYSDLNSKELIWYDSGFYRQEVDLGPAGSYQEFQQLQSTIDLNLLSQRYPWLLPEVKIQDQGVTYLKSAVWLRSTQISDKEILKSLLKRLYNAGYKIISGTIELQKNQPLEVMNLESFENMHIS